FSSASTLAGAFTFSSAFTLAGAFTFSSAFTLAGAFIANWRFLARCKTFFDCHPSISGCGRRTRCRVLCFRHDVFSSSLRFPACFFGAAVFACTS
ncbi:MAG: hypothetical protein WC130_04265, partial [Kiritimatiellia bacterium]